MSGWPQAGGFGSEVLLQREPDLLQRREGNDETMHRKRNAKIVATLGPASSAPDLIQVLFEAGVDVFRLNFSHGTQADHEARYRAIRAVEQKAGAPDRHPAGPAGSQDPHRQAAVAAGAARAR